MFGVTHLEPLQFDEDNIDRAMLEILQSADLDLSPIKFLMRCYDRLKRIASLDAVLSKTKELVLSYAGVALTMPDLFPCSQNDNLFNLLYPSSSLDASFFDDLVVACDDEIFSQFMNDALLELFKQASVQTILSTHNVPLLNAFNWLVMNKHVLPRLSCIPAISSFLDHVQVEKACFIGPFLSLSPLASEKVSAEIFGDFVSKSFGGSVESLFYANRSSMQMIMSSLHSLCLTCIKSSGGNKQMMLDYVVKSIEFNKKRGHLHIEEEQVSSEGFVVNLNLLMLKFCDPFMMNLQKVSLVDGLYFWKKPFASLATETLLKANAEQLQEFTSKQAVSECNFISDCFFMTSNLMHIGIVRSCISYFENLKQLKECKDAMEKVQHLSTSPMNQLYIKRLEVRCEK